MISEHEMVKKIYLELLLKLIDRVLQALQDIQAQAGALWAIHLVPGLDKPRQIAELGTTRGA